MRSNPLPTIVKWISQLFNKNAQPIKEEVQNIELGIRIPKVGETWYIKLPNGSSLTVGRITAKTAKTTTILLIRGYFESEFTYSSSDLEFVEIKE